MYPLQMLDKCPLTKCPLTKCPLAKRPLAKRPLAKCLLVICPDTKHCHTVAKSDEKLSKK